MGDATVPWFGPISPIGYQGTQKVTGGTTMRHDDGNGWHDEGDGQQGDSRHDNGNVQHDDDNGRHNGSDRRHDDGKVPTTEAGGTTMAKCSRHMTATGSTTTVTGGTKTGSTTAARGSRATGGTTTTTGGMMAAIDSMTTARGSRVTGGTLTATGGTTTRHNNGDRRHDGDDVARRRRWATR